MPRSSWLSVETTTAEAPIDAPDYCDTTMNNQERRVFAPVPANGAEALDSVATPATNGRHAPSNGRSSEHLQLELPVETLHLETAHHSPCACPLCGEPMREITTSEECWGETLIIRADNIAAYRCDPDDYEKPDITAEIAFLCGAADRFTRLGDNETALALRQELTAARKVERLLSTPSLA